MSDPPLDISGETPGVPKRATIAKFIKGQDQLNQNLTRILLAAREDISALRTDMGSLQTDMGSLKTDMGSLKTDVGSLKTDMGSLKTDVGSLKTDMGSLRTDMGLLQSEMGSLHTDMGSLQSEMGSLRTDVKLGIEALAKQVTGFRVDVMARLDEHSTKLTALDDDVELNMNAASSVMARQQGTRHEQDNMQAEIQVLRRIVHRLQTDVEELQKK